MSVEKSDRKKVVIIGGGAAGFFAAITCAEANPALKVIILERGKDVLGKVKVSGGGRCNVTHACFDPRELIQYYPRGAKALLGPFHSFCCGDTVDWYEKRGVATKIESDGRMFPTTDDSQTIMDCLVSAAKKAGVQIRKRTRVRNILAPTEERSQWLLEIDAEQPILADKLMIASGSNPKVWDLLAKLGHKIVPPVPSLFTFNIKDPRIDGLAGLSMPEAHLAIPGTKLSAEGPLLITHWGLSGPGILKLSAWGARVLHDLNYQFTLQVNWLAGQKFQDILSELRVLKQRIATKQVSSHAQFGLPQRLWKRMIESAEIGATQRWADLSKKHLSQLADTLTQANFTVKGKSTFKEEFVTAGGLDLKEINFKTFSSKHFPTLFFAGEVLNIDAVTGGFNFQAAWTGGWMAGNAMAQEC